MSKHKTGRYENAWAKGERACRVRQAVAAQRTISAVLLLITAMTFMACGQNQVVKDVDQTASSEGCVDAASSEGCIDQAGSEVVKPEPSAETGDEAMEDDHVLQPCDGIEDDEARTDCVAKAVASREELPSLQRHERCLEAPFPLRCYYLLALEGGEAQPCRQGRKELLRQYSRECELLQAIEDGDTKRCAQDLETDKSLHDGSDLVTICKRIATANTLYETPDPFDELPADGEGLHKLLARYYVAISYEEHLFRLARQGIYDARRLVWDQKDYDMWYGSIDSPGQISWAFERLIDVDFATAERFAKLFISTFGRSVDFHVQMRRFDPRTWDGLEQMLIAVRLYGTTHGASHIPQSTLTFSGDGSYRLRQRVTSVEDNHQQRFVLHEGSWEIVSAAAGDRWAIITLDEKQYVFGHCEGEFILHPAEEISEEISCEAISHHQYSSDEYTGEWG